MFDTVSLDILPILNRLTDLNDEEMHMKAKRCCLIEAI